MVKEMNNGARVLVTDTTIDVIQENITVFSFPVITAVNTEDGRDKDEVLSKPVFTEYNTHAHVEWYAVSPCWLEKTYLLDIYPDGFYYRVKVRGQGKVDTIHFFTGHHDDKFPGIEYEVSGFAIPEAANFDYYRMTRLMNTDGNISMGFMTPPCFVYPFWTERISSWTGVGLIAQRGQYNFNRFSYKTRNNENRGYFELPLECRTTVNGEWESQGIWCCAGTDAIDIVKKYSNFNYSHGFCSEGPKVKERWWKGPLYCGWGDQVEVSRMEHGNFNYVKTMANQAFYGKLSDGLDKLNLQPTAIIIDDKWQSKYGELEPDSDKWPDMRAFVDSQHKKGRKVILWVKVWNNEGLPEDECMCISGQPFAADPTNPKYRQRIYKAIRKLLSSDPECYNCDGFKLDFVNCIIMHNNIRLYDNFKYGIEIVKEMMKLFYDAAKQAKPDALINNSCAHPYFAEVTDQVRLHDYRDTLRSMMTVMKYRRDLFHAALPNALIDTDSSNRSNYREAKEYYLRAYELGVPDIYMIFGNDSVQFSESDWNEIRKVWQDYSSRMDQE